MSHITKMERLERYLMTSTAMAAVIVLCNDAVTDKLDQLSEELTTLDAQARNLQARADAEKRDLTADEVKALGEIFARFEEVEEEIERREQIAAISNRVAAPAGRKTEPNAGDDVDDAGPTKAKAAAARRKVPAQPIDRAEAARHGFANMGEFARSVMMAVRPGGGGVDPRLIANAPTTSSTEGTGADGGFAVPPEFRTTIMAKVMAENGLLARTDGQVTSSNTMTFPKDETTPWQSSGGIQASWEGEGDQATESKVALGEDTIKLNKLKALVPVTDELLSDAPALSSYIGKKAPEKFAFKINNAIINGTGVGQPKGILAADSLVTVAKESGQVADTIVYNNIVNMWARLYSEWRANSVWLINQDIEPQLLKLQFPGSGTAVPAYLPPGGLSAAPYGMLMGRPVIPTQACKTVGDLGDIILVDLKQYLSITKVEGLRQDVSMHLWFNYDTTAFRFVMRLAGQPWWSSTISPLNGSNTLSWAVALAARA